MASDTYEHPLAQYVKTLEIKVQKPIVFTGKYKNLARIRHDQTNYDALLEKLKTRYRQKKKSKNLKHEDLGKAIQHLRARVHFEIWRNSVDRVDKPS